MDLSRVRHLTMEVWLLESSPDSLQLSLALMARNARSRAPAVPLQQGRNNIAIDMQGGWLTPATRERAEQIEWELSSSGDGSAGWLVLGVIKAA